MHKYKRFVRVVTLGEHNLRMKSSNTSANVVLDSMQRSARIRSIITQDRGREGNNSSGVIYKKRNGLS